MALDVATLHFYWHAEATNDLLMKTDKHLLLLFFSGSYNTDTVQIHLELMKLIVSYKLFFFPVAHNYPRMFFFQDLFFILGLCPKAEWTASS